MHLIEFAYEDHIHSSIGVNPFYVLYGQECRTPIKLSTPNTRFESINTIIREMNEIRESSKLAMKSAHDKAKHSADNKRIFREFEVGDKMFLKVGPNRSRLKLRKSRKLSPRFCGPFEILKWIGKVAYELKLPEDWKIHDVFHVELLKNNVSNPNHILRELPKVVPKRKLLVELEDILKIENQHLRYKTFRRFYVKWKEYPGEEASWEREVDFRRDYPNFVIVDNGF